MSQHLKTIARNLLPLKYQVAAKYWFGWLNEGLEEEMKLLSFLVKENARVIDVGGNRGIYAYSLWRLGAIVEVFEPNPTCMNVLQAWAMGKSTVHLHPVALSSCEGAASLNIPVDEAGTEHDASASIEHAAFEQSRSQQVMLKTLDSFGFDSVTFIKIDVEGHEYNVIEGATATINASRPALLVEIEQRHIKRPIGEVFERVQRLGYQGFFSEEGRLTKLEKFHPGTHQSMENFGDSKKTYTNNFLFLHQDRVAAGDYGSISEGMTLQ